MFSFTEQEEALLKRAHIKLAIEANKRATRELAHEFTGIDAYIHERSAMDLCDRETAALDAAMVVISCHGYRIRKAHIKDTLVKASVFEIIKTAGLDESVY